MKSLENVCFGFGVITVPLNLALYFALAGSPIQLVLVGLGAIALVWSTAKKLRRGSFL